MSTLGGYYTWCGGSWGRVLGLRERETAEWSSHATHSTCRSVCVSVWGRERDGEGWGGRERDGMHLALSSYALFPPWWLTRKATSDSAVFLQWSTSCMKVANSLHGLLDLAIYMYGRRENQPKYSRSLSPCYNTCTGMRIVATEHSVTIMSGWSHSQTPSN